VLEHVVYTERVGGGRQSASSCPVKADQNCGTGYGASLCSIKNNCFLVSILRRSWETSREAHFTSLPELSAKPVSGPSFS
jgi:hypothetical protein